MLTAGLCGFIVGVPRSGTTLLATILNRHPLVCVTPETYFFSLTEQYPGGRTAFLRELPHSLDVLKRIEATGNCMAVSRVLSPFVKRVIIANPLQVKAIAHAHVKTDKIDAGTLASLYAAGSGCDRLDVAHRPRLLGSVRNSVCEA